MSRTTDDMAEYLREVVPLIRNMGRGDTAYLESMLKRYEYEKSRANTSEKCWECGERTRYQGHPNYETWAFVLQLDNDEGWQRECIALGRNCRDLHEFAEALKDAWTEYIDEYLDGHGIAGVGGLPFPELYSLGNVDWLDVAEHFQDEIGEDLDDEEDDDEDDLSADEIADRIGREREAAAQEQLGHDESA